MMRIEDADGTVVVRAMVAVTCPPPKDAPEYRRIYCRKMTLERCWSVPLQHAAERVQAWRDANPGLDVMGTFTVQL